MNPRINLTAKDDTAAAFAGVTRRVEKLGLNFDALKVSAVSALGALSIPISAAGVLSMLSTTRAVIDGFNDLSDATGASIENISALDQIARATGSNFEQVSSTLLRFNQVLKDADPKRGAGAVLKALNLDIEELKRLDPAEALRQTAIALEGFADDGGKARAVQELFGKSVREAAPFLKDLATQGKLVGTVSTEAAKEVDEYGKAIDRLRAYAEDAQRSLVLKFVPAINRMIEDVSSFPEKANLAGLASDVIRLDKQLKALEERRGSPFNFAGNLEKEIQDTTRMLDAAKAAFNAADTNRPRSAGGGRGFVNPPNASTLPSLTIPEESKDPRGTPKDALAESKRYLENLQRQLEALEELSALGQAQRDLDLGRLGQVTAEQKRLILATAQQIDLERELTKATKEDADLRKQAAADARDAENSRKQRIKDLVGAGETERLEAQRATIAELTAAYEKGELGLFGSAEAQRKYTEAVQAFLGIAPDQVQAISEIDEFTRRAAENIQDYLGESLFNVLEGNFDDILGSFMSMLNRMVAEAAAAQLSKYFFGSLGGGSGSGLFGDVLGAAAGALFGTGGTAALASSMGGNSLDNFLNLNNNFSGASVPSFDVGSDFVPRDMLALVHRGEAIIPAAENMQGGGRGETIINNFSIQGPVDRRSEATLAKAATRALQRAQRWV